MKEIPDGNVRWDGGMDASRFPDLINENQYSRACNFIIPRNGGGLQVRGGIHHQYIDFNYDCKAEENFKNGNFQGEGYFIKNGEQFLVCSISGYIYVLREKSNGSFSAQLVNRNDRNDRFTKRVSICRYPGHVIVCNGIDNAVLVSDEVFKRASGPSEVSNPAMAVYVQNRVFYVENDFINITYSDFGTPFSTLDTKRFNVRGFASPESDDPITAIGKQKAILNYVDGGVLAFSTSDNLYSVDVRSSPDQWEAGSGSLGKVQETVRGVGAVSQYSFEPFNTNLYFRTFEHGIADLKQSQFQFVNEGDITDQSIEVDCWIGNDTSAMLSNCYSRGYKSRMYTTIAPQINDEGFVYWNGMVVMNPDPVYSNQKRSQRRFEGIMTGVRPWALTVSKGSVNGQRMFIWSHDDDGVTRLYSYRDDSSYDVNRNGERIEIESWVETRGFNHTSSMVLKKPVSRYYKLRSIKRDCSIGCYSRTEASGEWMRYDRKIHRASFTPKNLSQVFSNNKHQARDRVNLNKEKDAIGSVPGNLGGDNFFVRQDRFECKGHFILDKFIRLATAEPNDQCVMSSNESLFSPDEYSARMDFTYSINSSNHKVKDERFITLS